MRVALRALPAIVALTVVGLLAAGPAAADEVYPSAGSTQICVAAPGGFLLQLTGFGTSFPANTTGTNTFTFADGHVVSLTATTTSDGIFHTATFTLDLRDPQQAALVGTNVYETADFGDVHTELTFSLVGCPTAPGGKVDCMAGGYLSYPGLGFLNQGDCVSWIATQGKNEPGQNVP